MPGFDAILKEWVPARIFAPGTTPAYSNYAASLAGYIVQRVSGMPFNDYVTKNIFAPLGMTSTTFQQPLPESWKPRMSKGYKDASHPPRKFELVGPAPAGSVSTTAADMARFMIAHLQDGRYGEQRILQDATAIQEVVVHPILKRRPSTATAVAFIALLVVSFVVIPLVATNYWLTAMIPENSVVIHKSDADRLGLKEGDRVKVLSATNPEGVWDFRNGHKKEMIGQVKITQTIKPGVVTFNLGYGHWATGAADVTIDGKIIKGDPRRGKGVHLNAAMWIDPYLKNTTLQDPVGGSAVFYQTQVKLVKV